MMRQRVPAKKSTSQEQTPEQRDAFQAQVIDTVYDTSSYLGVDVLLHTAHSLQNHFETGGPQTRQVAAQKLLGYYRELKKLEESAQRGDDRALLHRTIGGHEPWTPKRPDDVEDIDPFSADNIIEWSDATQITLREATGRTQRVKAPPTPKGEPLELTEADIERFKQGKTTKKRPGAKVGSALQTLKETPFEQAADKEMGGGKEIDNGLQTLKGATESDAVNAIARLLNENEDTAGVEPVMPEKNGDLFSKTGIIWYITGGQVYAVDRTGHIVQNEFAFRVEGIQNMKPGAVYFHAPFPFQSGKTGKPYMQKIMLRLDGGTKVEWADFVPSSMLADFVPLLKMGADAFKQGGGIAIIVSPKITKRLSFSDFDTDNLETALYRAADHIPWAVNSEIAKMKLNPGQVIVGELIGLTAEMLAKVFPPTRGAMLAYQALELSSWLGQTARIAGYGNQDEVDLAAQSIARKMAEWTIGQLISGGVNLGRRGVGKAMNRPDAPAQHPEADVEAPTRTEPQTSSETTRHPEQDTVPVRGEDAPPRTTTTQKEQPSETTARQESAPPRERQRDEDTHAEVVDLQQRRAARQREAELQRQREEEAQLEREQAEAARRQREREREEADEAERKRLEEAGADPEKVESLDIRRRQKERQAEQETEQQRVQEEVEQRTGTDDRPTVKAMGGGDDQYPLPTGLTGSQTRSTTRQSSRSSSRSTTVNPPASHRATPIRPAARRTNIQLPPEPQLSNRKAALVDRLNFMHQNRHLLGPVQQKRLDKLRTRVLAGKRKTASGFPIRRWEKRIDKGLRDEYAHDLTNAYGFPVVGTAHIPNTPAGNIERRLQELETGRQETLSVTARTRDGETVQIDGYNHTAGVPREVKYYRQALSPEMHRPSDDPRPRWMQRRDREEIYEPDVVDLMKRNREAKNVQRRMEQTFDETIHKMRDQMRRQAQLALDYGFPYYEWRVPREYMDDFDIMVRQNLPKHLRDVIWIRELQDVD